MYIKNSTKYVQEVLSQYSNWNKFTVTGGKTGEEYVMQEISRLSTVIRGDVRLSPGCF